MDLNVPVTEYILKIKATSTKLIEWYNNHGHFCSGDSGIDLFCNESSLVKAGDTVKLNFSISCALICRTTITIKEFGGIRENKIKEEFVSYLLIPRSSIAKTPLRMSNSVGLIDSLYRGPIMAYVDNIKTTDYTVGEKQRLFQIVAPGLSPIGKVEVCNNFDLDNENKLLRYGGFGSTGY